jgi:hypothetical protein
MAKKAATINTVRAREGEIFQHIQIKRKDRSMHIDNLIIVLIALARIAFEMTATFLVSAIIYYLVSLKQTNRHSFNNHLISEGK